MDAGKPERDYLKDMLKMREEFKTLSREKKRQLKRLIKRAGVI